VRPREAPSWRDARRLSSEAPRRPFSGAALVLVAAVVLSLLVYYAEFSRSLQWLLGLAFLGLIVALAWRLIVRGTSEPGPLVATQTSGPYIPGELGALSVSVRRATRGLRYSQVLVTSRARVAFLDRARLALGLSPEAMREVQRDRAKLRHLFRDDALAEFLHIRVGDLEEQYEWVLRARGWGGFARDFRDVLSRMEAWR